MSKFAIDSQFLKQLRSTTEQMPALVITLKTVNSVFVAADFVFIGRFRLIDGKIYAWCN
jgi:hypothetical protein